MTGHGPVSENRLARERSPYLLQHARNPVDWYPWGEEAIAAARARDVPIFLSIGYSTCHWCHVMERESFEDGAIAALLNANFVPVKVDREERPDVDQLYMTAAQAMGVGGGWPLNLFLTPGLAPFGGGTYIPPVTRGGRTGMDVLLPRVAEVWRERREEIADDSGRVLAHLASIDAPGEAGVTAERLAQECAELLARAHDARHGGFGSAPKFPSPSNLAFLLRWWAGDPDGRADALAMACGQLDAMIAGGIHDQLGGGFHRYSTDRTWLVPHFEKMLYDQALIADACLDAFLATGEGRYALAARGVFAYLRRDLAAEGGAFCSAEDADSEGEEGRFYVWTPAQLEAVLGADDARLAAHHWGVTPQGNFEHGASILHAAQPLAATARTFGLDETDAASRLERARVALLAARARRVRPHRDDKVLAAWNGLAIAALARGARALGDPSLAAAAERAATFVWVQLRDPATGALRRRWRDGEAALEAQLDDHAAMARACLELHAAGHEPVWLERAVSLTDAMLAAFWDDAQGALFAGPAGAPGAPAPPVRLKEGHDGAETAGASLAAANLLRLSALLPREDLRVKAERLLDYYARRLSRGAWAMPQMLVAMDLAARSPRHVVVAGEPSPGRNALLAVYETRFRPFDDLVVVAERTRPALAALAPFTSALRPIDGRATAYVCVDHACRLPVSDPEAFAALLDDDSR